MIQVAKLSDLESYREAELVVGYPVKFERQHLEHYLALSGDKNPIHHSGALSQRIVPANLLISVIPAILQSHIEFDAHIQCFTVGYRNVKFKRQAKLNDEMSLFVKLGAVRLRTGTAYLDYRFQFELDEDRSNLAHGIMSDFYVDAPPNSSD